MKFKDRIIYLALAIPAGQVTTYGQLAKAAGAGGQAARSVSSILGTYPNQRAIPWHRIVYAGGRVWLTPELADTRLKQLAKEGIAVNEKGYIQNFEEILVDFSELT